MKHLTGLIVIAAVLLTSVSCPAQGPDYGIKGSVSGDVYFETGSLALSDKAKKEMSEVYAWMDKHPSAMVLLAGYDDQRTPQEESVELGWKRAGAVRDYLISLGAEPARINMISFGNTRVAFPGAGEEAWSKNRRVRYRVVEPADTEKMEGRPSGVCQRCKK